MKAIRPILLLTVLTLGFQMAGRAEDPKPGSLAAARFLATQPYVDTNRIYLGGHSTGGTLALLVSESTSVFRAVFAFGPVDDVRGYGTGKRNELVPADLTDRTGDPPGHRRTLQREAGGTRS